MSSRSAGYCYLILALIVMLPGTAYPATASDAEIKAKIIRESMAAYPGNCPCPDSRASNGSRCGKRSAWSKGGGYAPLCYPDEISDEQVEAYKKTHNGSN